MTQAVSPYTMRVIMYSPLFAHNTHTHTHFFVVAPSSIVMCITFNSVFDFFIKCPEVKSLSVKPHIEMFNVWVKPLSVFLYASVLIMFLS